MEHNHHRWIQEASERIQKDWVRLHANAAQNGRTQEVGHENEAIWQKFLTNWLPPQYEVGTRKYIVGPRETSEKPFETDVVIFSPGYPRGLRQETHIMASGVAAAFSTKLTLRRDGLFEAARSSAALQRSLEPQNGHARSELWKSFAYGVLSASHDWKSPASSPEENVLKILSDADDDAAMSPADGLDLICIADLGVWVKSIAYMPDPAMNIEIDQVMSSHNHVRTHGNIHLATFLTALYERLSWDNHDMAGIAHDFRTTNDVEQASGFMRMWDAKNVLTEDATRKLRSNWPGQGPSNELDSWHQMLW